MRGKAKRGRALRRLVPLALLLCAFLAAPSVAEPAPRGYGGVPGGVGAMAMGADGTLWFTGKGGQLGRVKPDGSFESMVGGFGYGWDLAIDADGNFWGAGWGGFARMSPAGEVTQFPLSEELGDPSAIVAAPGGGVWFVSWRQQDWKGAAYVGRVAEDGGVKSFPLPGDSGARTSAPSAIALGPDGNIWVADQALAKIDRVSPDGQIASFALPSVPISLTAGPEGAIWYLARRQIGRLSLGGEVTEFPLPGGYWSRIIAGPDGNLWFGGWQVGRMTPWGQVSIYETGAESVGDLAAGTDGSIWVGTLGNPIKWVPGTIMKLSTGQPGVELASAEAVVKDGRFAVVLECGGSPAVGCAGKVEFGRGGKASLRSYAIPPESRRTLQLRLPAAAQERLARQRFWRERFRVTVEGGKGAVREVVLRVPRPLRQQVPPGRLVRIPLFDELAVGALARGHDGDLWFADRWANRIVRMTPRGEFRSYRLPAPGRAPGAVTAGPLRSIWFLAEVTRQGRRYPVLGRLSADGEFSELPLPGEIPATDLLAGPDGNLWVVRASHSNGEIDRVTPQGGVTQLPMRKPEAIAPGPGGIWFADAGPTVGRIAPSGKITRFRVPEGGSVADLVAGPDGNVWFVHRDRKGGPTVGRVTPRGKIAEFPIHRRGHHGRVLDSIVAGRDGNLWLAENSPPRLNRVTPRGKVTHFRLPHDVEDPAGLIVGPGGDLWFSQWRKDEVGIFGLPGRGGPCPARSVPENC